MSREGFILDVVYENSEESGALTNYISEGTIEGIPLIRLLNLDNLDQQMEARSDGLFDFIEGVTARSIKWENNFSCKRAIWIVLPK